jgi:hypothetical protein
VVDDVGMTHDQIAFVVKGDTGYGYSVASPQLDTHGGCHAVWYEWRVISGPYTTREQAQDEADRVNAERCAA